MKLKLTFIILRALSIFFASFTDTIWSFRSMSRDTEEEAIQHTMHNMTLVQKMCAIISKALAVADEADPRAAARPRARRGSRLRQPQQLLHQASAPDDSGDIQHNQHNQQTSPTSHTHTRPGSQMGFSFFTTLSGSKRDPFRYL